MVWLTRCSALDSLPACFTAWQGDKSYENEKTLKNIKTTNLKHLTKTYRRMFFFFFGGAIYMPLFNIFNFEPAPRGLPFFLVSGPSHPLKLEMEGMR